jgi:hemolysin D
MASVLVLKLQAGAELCRRYAAIFRMTWRVRRELDSQPRLAHEAQFLPAALELQETPVSPAPRVAMWLLIGFALVAALWSAFGYIDIVATAQGKIVPNDRVKVIQPLEAATVKAIHVTDGQAVKAGEILVELDATAADADTARTAGDLRAARLQEARAKAMIASLGADRLTALGAVADADAAEVARENRLLEGQFGEFQAKRAQIDADNRRREAELRSTEEIVRKLEQTVPIARERAKNLKELADQQYVARHDYLDKEQARLEQEADLATQRSRLNELTAAIESGRRQRDALLAETRRGALDSLNEATQKMAATGQDFIKAQTRGKQMALTAPVDGSVQQLAVHTVGGVVTPAQQLMVVVPRDNLLEVEAFLENKDIGFVNEGQDVVVKIETFPYTRYGTIPGRVVQVSQDAINDDKKGLIYSARVKLERSSIRIENKSVALGPGMAVTAEIKTGRRRIAEYFLSPLLQYRDESFRER